MFEDEENLIMLISLFLSAIPSLLILIEIKRYTENFIFLWSTFLVIWFILAFLICVILFFIREYFNH